MAEGEGNNGSFRLTWANAFVTGLLAYAGFVGIQLIVQSNELTAIREQLAYLHGSVTEVTADRYTGAQAALDREASRRQSDRMQSQIDALDSRLRTVERGNYGGTP